MNASLESCLFKMAKTATATKDLGLHNVSCRFELGGDSKGFLGSASYVSQRDSHLVGVEQGACLVLVELHAADWG